MAACPSSSVLRLLLPPLQTSWPVLPVPRSSVFACVWHCWLSSLQLSPLNHKSNPHNYIYQQIFQFCYFMTYELWLVEYTNSYYNLISYWFFVDFTANAAVSGLLTSQLELFQYEYFPQSSIHQRNSLSQSWLASRILDYTIWRSWPWPPTARSWPWPWRKGLGFRVGFLPWQKVFLPGQWKKPAKTMVQ